MARGLLELTRLKSHKTTLSDIQVLACGIPLKNYPRDDMLWAALSSLDINKLIDVRRFNKYINENQKSLNKKSDARRNGEFYKITRKIYSFYSLFIYAISTSRIAHKENVDIIFVFPRNHLLAISLSLFRFYHKAKIYFDLHVSPYSIAKSNSSGTFAATKSWVIEFLCVKLADQLLCYTPEYAHYYAKTYKSNTAKFIAIRDGVQEVWFEKPISPRFPGKTSLERPRRILYWGNFLIQHGLDVIINAAEILKADHVEFLIAGTGRHEISLRNEVARRNLTNVIFNGYVPTIGQLIDLVDSADLTFGHLRDTHDARLVESNKLRQAMARGKPVVTLWTKQKEDLFCTNIYNCPPLVMIKDPDGDSVAQTIRDLLAKPQKLEQVGRTAKATAERLYTIDKVATDLKACIERIFSE